MKGSLSLPCIALAKPGRAQVTHWMLSLRSQLTGTPSDHRPSATSLVFSMDSTSSTCFLAMWSNHVCGHMLVGESPFAKQLTPPPPPKSQSKPLFSNESLWWGWVFLVVHSTATGIECMAPTGQSPEFPAVPSQEDQQWEGRKETHIHRLQKPKIYSDSIEGTSPIHKQR